MLPQCGQKRQYNGDCIDWTPNSPRPCTKPNEIRVPPICRQVSRHALNEIVARIVLPSQTYRKKTGRFAHAAVEHVVIVGGKYRNRNKPYVRRGCAATRGPAVWDLNHEMCQIGSEPLGEKTTVVATCKTAAAAAAKWLSGAVLAVVWLDGNHGMGKMIGA